MAFTNRPMAAKPGLTVGWPTPAILGKVRIHPKNPDIVYVAALGHAFGQEQRARRLQIDRWRQKLEQVLFKSDKAGAIDLTFDPNNPDMLYASDLAGLSQLLGTYQRWPRQRHLEIDRWRRNLDRHHAQHRACPKGILGKIGLSRLAGAGGAGLGAGRSQKRARHVSLR